MNKEAVIIKGLIVEKLVKILTETALLTKKKIEQTRRAAIEAPGRMQSRYDSSKQEYSYQVDGLQKSLLKIQQGIEMLHEFKVNKLSFDKVTMGSIVQVRKNSEKIFYFILPVGGGNVFETEQFGKITIIAPEAPITKLLLDKRKDDSVLIGSRKLCIVSVF